MIWPVLKTPCLKTRPPPGGGIVELTWGIVMCVFHLFAVGPGGGVSLSAFCTGRPATPKTNPDINIFTTRITKNIDSSTLAERLFGLRAMKYKHFCSPELPQGPPRDPRGPPRDPAGPLRASPGDPRGPPRDPWAPHVQ